ncbi:hypothetical protein KIPB_012211, partial [Kipferlia bialata]
EFRRTLEDKSTARQWQIGAGEEEEEVEGEGEDSDFGSDE